MPIPELMHVSEGPQRFDVFTGAGRRRRFTAGEKAAIVDESYADGNSVCGVVRRHGLSSQQLFGWRRLARLGPSRSVERPLFVPVIVAPEPEPPRNEPPRNEPPRNEPPRNEPPTPSKPRRRRRNEGASIELEIDGVVVRVGRDADTAVVNVVDHSHLPTYKRTLTPPPTPGVFFDVERYRTGKCG